MVASIPPNCKFLYEYNWISFCCSQLLELCHIARDLTNVVPEWLALLLHTLEVLSSNLSLEAGYPDRLFSVLQEFFVVIHSLSRQVLK
jgi:hypothetical protein